VSTETLTPGARAGFDLDRPWRLHPKVSVRPERFGALLYHFGTRRLSFLKSPREACRSAGVTEAELPAYAAALETLASSQMICARVSS
jgi:mycofactocin biosynthesis protein MftB